MTSSTTFCLKAKVGPPTQIINLMRNEMSTPQVNPDVPQTAAPKTLEQRIVALEAVAVTDARTAWHKVDAFFWTVLSHVRNISVAAVALSFAALALEVYHQIGL